MKLAVKLATWLLLPMTIVIVVNAVFRVHREHLLFEHETTQTHRALGKALAAGIADVSGDPAPRVEAFLREANDDGSDRRLVWQPIGTAWTAEEQREFALHHEIVTSLDGSLRTLYPVFVGGRMAGVIAIEEAKNAEREYLIGSIARTVAQTLLLIALCMTVALLAGLRLVGRPIAALTRQARAVGEGDFTQRVPERFDGEFDELARALNRMTDELTLAQDRLQRETQQKEQALARLRHADRLVTVGQLSAGIAHELGTPLNVVLGRSQEIVDGDVDFEGARKNAGVVVTQVGRMTSIVRGLLDFARPRRATRREAEAGVVFERVGAMLSSLAAKRGTRLVVSTTEPVSFVADVEQVEQVVVNLAMNGIQAMPSGGTLQLSVTHEQRAAPGSAESRAWCCLRVADQGTGIPPAIREKIFDPFFTTKDPGEGTGLGLAVTWGLVAQNGGFVTFETEEGKGTTFLVFLPVEKSE